MNELFLQMIESSFPLKEEAPGSLNRFKVQGMNFTTRSFTAEGLGHVAIMSASGMLGMMKMTTIVVNPFQVDAPLLSYDRIQAMGKEKLYVELFDTMLDPAGFETKGLDEAAKQFASLEDFDAGAHWYDDMYVVKPLLKEGKKKNALVFDRCFAAYLKAYLSAAAASPACDEEKKREKAAVYSEGLLKNGGPATDPVKAAIGEEKTAAFFRNVLFGTARKSEG